jgi:hypothetical protein
MDTDIGSCIQLENQTVAWELTCGFRDNTFVKYSNGTHEGGDPYWFAILDKANPDIESIRGLNLAAVKHTTVQVTRLPF